MSSSTDVAVGRIRRAHGVRGDVLIDVYSDHPDRFVPGSKLHTEDGAPFIVEWVRPHREGVVAHFTGLDDRTAAESLRGQLLFIGTEERRSLDADEYWPDELVGLTVIGPQGEALGVVVDVVVAAQDRLVVEGASGRFDVPFVAELVPEVDLSARVLKLAPIPGLFDDVS